MSLALSYQQKIAPEIGTTMLDVYGREPYHYAQFRHVGLKLARLVS